MYYVLDKDKVSKKIECYQEWLTWMERASNTRVASTENESVSVSTIFCGIDTRLGSGVPLLFETRVFGGLSNNGSWKSATWNEAILAHHAICRLVF